MTMQLPTRKNQLRKSKTAAFLVVPTADFAKTPFGECARWPTIANYDNSHKGYFVAGLFFDEEDFSCFFTDDFIYCAGDGYWSANVKAEPELTIEAWKPLAEMGRSDKNYLCKPKDASARDRLFKIFPHIDGWPVSVEFDMFLQGYRLFGGAIPALVPVSNSKIVDDLVCKSKGESLVALAKELDESLDELRAARTEAGQIWCETERLLAAEKREREARKKYWAAVEKDKAQVNAKKL